MKFEFYEDSHDGGVNLMPETAAEFAQLARLAKNAKREPVNIYLSFSNDRPFLNIGVSKVRPGVQTNSINNRKP